MTSQVAVNGIATVEGAGLARENGVTMVPCLATM